jgi:hypothetical protein
MLRVHAVPCTSTCYNLRRTDTQQERAERARRPVQPSTSHRLQVHRASHHGTTATTTAVSTDAADSTGAGANVQQLPVSPRAAALNAMSGITADVNDFLSSADNGSSSTSSSSNSANNVRDSALKAADDVPQRRATIAVATAPTVRVRDAIARPTACAYMPGTAAAFDSVGAAIADIRYFVFICLKFYPFLIRNCLTLCSMKVALCCEIMECFSSSVICC